MRGVTGAALGFALGAAAVGGLWHRATTNEDDPENSIVMPAVLWQDLPEQVRFGGSIAGDHVGYKTNHYSAVCSRDTMRCETVSFEQIGANQIGDVTLYAIPIVSWTTGLIVAREPDDGISCARVTLNIERTSREVEYVAEPVNQTKVTCAKAENKLYRWRIEDPSMWKKPGKSFSMF